MTEQTVTAEAFYELQRQHDDLQIKYGRLEEALKSADYTSKLRSWAVDRVVQLNMRAQSPVEICHVVDQAEELMKYLDVKVEAA